MGKAEKSAEFFKKGIDRDNAKDLEGAIAFYSKSIRLTKHPKAFYNRACVYMAQNKYKEAIKDFKNCLKYGPSDSNEAMASEYTIEQLEKRISMASSAAGKPSNYPCPRCKNKFVITGKGHFPGSIKLVCPKCGMTMTNLKP